jgi:cell division protein ZapA
MAQVALDINGRRYEMACDDGEEERLRRVGHFVDQRVRALARHVGPVGENRMLLMIALMISDELLDTVEGGGGMQGHEPSAPASASGAGRREPDPEEVEALRAEAGEQAAEALDSVAERLERIAARLEAS